MAITETRARGAGRANVERDSKRACRSAITVDAEASPTSAAGSRGGVCIAAKHHVDLGGERSAYGRRCHYATVSVRLHGVTSLAAVVCSRRSEAFSALSSAILATIAEAAATRGCHLIGGGD